MFSYTALLSSVGGVAAKESTSSMCSISEIGTTSRSGPLYSKPEGTAAGQVF